MLTILVDTREQTPWEFPLAKVKKQKLIAGDYSIFGKTTEIVIERKTASDLFHTLTRGGDRFAAEMQRLRAVRYRAVVVEANQEQIKNGVWSSGANGPRVLDHFLRVCMQWGAAPVFCRGPQEAQDTAWRMLRGWHELSMRGAGGGGGGDPEGAP